MLETAGGPEGAKVLLGLLRERPSWILAQRADFSWVSATQLIRKTQIDFSLRRIAGLVQEKPYVYLPVADIDKHLSPQMLSVFDETGKRLPTLPRTQSMQLAALALLASRPAPKLSEEMVALVSGLALYDPADSERFLKEIAALPDPPFDDEDPLARALVWTYPLLVEVSTNDMSHRSLSFEVADTMKRVHRPSSEISRTLGWTSWSVWIAMSSPVSAGSSEFVVRAPNGASLSSALILVDDEDQELAEKPEVDGFAGPGRTSAVRLSPKHVRSRSLVMLAVDLAPDRSYTLGVLATATLVAAMLTAGLCHLEAMQSASDAAATVLLAGPGLLSALVAQPGRGSLAAQLVVGARAILIWSALLAYLAAGSLVALVSIEELEDIWLALVALAWMNVALLMPAVLNPGAIWRARKARRAKNGQADIRVDLE